VKAEVVELSIEAREEEPGRCVQICTRKRVCVNEQRACATDADWGGVVVRVLFETCRFGMDAEAEETLATSAVLAKYV
jgi:hypothetical protein